VVLIAAQKYVILVIVSHVFVLLLLHSLVLVARSLRMMAHGPEKRVLILSLHVIKCVANYSAVVPIDVRRYAMTPTVETVNRLSKDSVDVQVRYYLSLVNLQEARILLRRRLLLMRIVTCVVISYVVPK